MYQYYHQFGTIHGRAKVGHKQVTNDVYFPGNGVGKGVVIEGYYFERFNLSRLVWEHAVWISKERMEEQIRNNDFCPANDEQAERWSKL